MTNFLTNSFLKITLTTSIVAILLTACGQKGALYLPEKPNTAVVSPQATPTDDSEKPAISDNPQNPNVQNSTVQKTENSQGNANDY